MRQDITLTINTTIRTDETEVKAAIERLGVNVVRIEVTKPYRISAEDRRAERDQRNDHTADN